MKGIGSGKSNPRGAAPYRFENGTLTLHVQVQPGASRSEWAGRYGEQALRLRVAAPPVDGKANRACREFVAETLGVPLSHVQIVRGETARNKTLVAHSVEPERWAQLRNLWEGG
jgi:uncharacterized protein (TIGR00251 family)